jgi:hypothetical protein
MVAPRNICRGWQSGHSHVGGKEEALLIRT